MYYYNTYVFGICIAEYLDNINLRLRRDFHHETDASEDDVEEEAYEFENENSDRPRPIRSTAYEDEIQNDVDDINYRLK